MAARSKKTAAPRRRTEAVPPPASGRRLHGKNRRTSGKRFLRTRDLVLQVPVPEEGAELHFLTKLWGQPSLTFRGHEYHAPFECRESFEDPIRRSTRNPVSAQPVRSGSISMLYRALAQPPGFWDGDPPVRVPGPRHPQRGRHLGGHRGPGVQVRPERADHQWRPDPGEAVGPGQPLPLPPASLRSGH